MQLLWPKFLLCLGLIPCVIALYVWVLRRRKPFAVRYSSLALLQDAAPRLSWWRRHLPFLLFTAALISLVMAMARPVAPQDVLTGRTTIILTLDISRSMCMQDILPNRLAVAKSTAQSFVEHPVLGTQIGIVAFSGFAEVAQKPTTEPTLLENAIGNLTTATQTAIGSAILTALDAIADVDKRVAPTQAAQTPDLPSIPPQSKSPHAHYVPHIIVLLTDGASNTGPSPLSAAQAAAARGVRVYSIGFGTENGGIMDCWSTSSSDPLSGLSLNSQTKTGSSGSRPDEATLKQIAKITGGRFYSATSAGELQAVFRDLQSTIVTTNKTIEVSVLFAGLGVLMALAALLLAVLWHPLL